MSKEIKFDRKELNILFTALMDSTDVTNKEIGESLKAGNRQAMADSAERRLALYELREKVRRVIDGNKCDCGCGQYL